MADKYMEQAIAEESNARGCAYEIIRMAAKVNPNGEIDRILRLRASELELLAMLRRAVTELAYVVESPTLELCQTSDGIAIVREGGRLLERYKDVKTD